MKFFKTRATSVKTRIYHSSAIAKSALVNAANDNCDGRKYANTGGFEGVRVNPLVFKN